MTRPSFSRNLLKVPRANPTRNCVAFFLSEYLDFGIGSPDPVAGPAEGRPPHLVPIDRSLSGRGLADAALWRRWHRMRLSAVPLACCDLGSEFKR